ncbi:hypothetical protein V1508DRAFT_50936 [Lipomyces doorenjongii]|uniref:uncharacterized protein n=1 Tax=Lipomyces doorenjongii TaxID=383834 RepID=UPI0034CFD89A
MSSFVLSTQTGDLTLSPPGSNVELPFLALGRGTQNYSCNSTMSKPVSKGALAILYDLGPLLEYSPPDLLHTLPSYVLDMASPLVPLSAAGSHFFDSTGVPNFDLLSRGLSVKGITAETIPTTTPPASLGLPRSPTNPMNWLHLTPRIVGLVVRLTDVYRVEVAGGSSPATCTNVTAMTFQVQYAAIYAFYGPKR